VGQGLFSGLRGKTECDERAAMQFMGRCVHIYITLFVSLVSLSAAVTQNVGEVQATVAGNHLYIPLRINGQNARPWLVDTGAFPCVISEGEANQLKLEAPSADSKLPGSLSSAGKPHRVVIASDLSCGTMSFGKVPMVVSTRGGPADYLNQPRNSAADSIGIGHIRQFRNEFLSGGILGLGLLSKFGAVINYINGQIFFSVHGGALPVQRQNYERMGYSYVPLEVRNNRRLEVVGTIGGSEYSFVIDTGAAHTVLFDQIRVKQHVPAFLSSARMVGGFHNFKNQGLWVGRVPGFRLGNQDVSDTSVAFGQMYAPEHGLSHPFGGFIGPDILAEHSAIIDIGHRALYLKPNGKRG
jgi:predicted aspartyl protease